MIIVDAPEDCGNAPRKRTIREFFIALYEELDTALNYLSDAVHWEMVGSWSATGKAMVREHLLRNAEVERLCINKIITHGTDCGVDGKFTTKDGQSYAFCHVLIFTGGAKTAKIKTVRSYLIKLGTD